MRPVQKIRPDWAVTSCAGRTPRTLSSIYINPDDEEVANYRMLDNWFNIQASEVRYKEYYLDDAEIVVVGFGTAGRVALSAVRSARQMGIPVGLLRPVSLSPFPFEAISQAAQHAQSLLVVEMNTGQMLEDVRLAVHDPRPVEFYGRPGGTIPFPDEILGEIQRMAHEPLVTGGDPRLRWRMRLIARQN
jgi:2-oxoglutarate ferredoxin oxidoreductase subunit alpha